MIVPEAIPVLLSTEETAGAVIRALGAHFNPEGDAAEQRRRNTKGVREANEPTQHITSHSAIQKC